MDLEEKLFGGVRDRKLLQLYTALTKSDLKGNYEDTYVLEMMFALMCLDLTANVKYRYHFIPSEFTLLARNVVRMADDGNLSDYSFMNWSDALLTYMKGNNLLPKHINKMSTDRLKQEVEVYLTKGSE